LEQAHRPAMAHHVPRIATPGQWVLINARCDDKERPA
jgi:hypothetical protein